LAAPPVLCSLVLHDVVLHAVHHGVQHAGLQHVLRLVRLPDGLRADVLHVA
jgi:hypothetical protein